MKNELKADQIALKLFSEPQNQAFLNNKTIKIDQVTRLLQKMIDKYYGVYKNRTPSKERARYNDENKENN